MHWKRNCSVRKQINTKPKAPVSTDNHLYVIPYRSGQLGIAVIGFVHEIFCVSELVVEDHSQVGVEGGQDGVAVLVPAVVLQQSAIISSLQMLVSSIIYYLSSRHLSLDGNNISRVVESRL